MREELPPYIPIYKVNTGDGLGLHFLGGIVCAVLLS